MSQTIRELDVVALTRDVPSHGLMKGQVGTVVMEHSPESVEVEFSDEHGRTYAVLAMPVSILLRLHYHRVEAA